MTLTFNTHLHVLSFTELVVCIYKFSGHCFPIFPPGSSLEQTIMGRSPRCYIPSFVEIDLPVPVKKIFEGFLPYMGMAAILVM